MKNMKNEETLMVSPISKEKIMELLATLPKEENTELIADVDALCEDVIIVDTDCCYSFLEPRHHDGSVRVVYDLPVKIKRKTEVGWSYPMFVSYYYPITLTDLKEKYVLPQVSLREYMGSRYDYNPRINKNMRDFLEEMNEITATP